MKRHNILLASVVAFAVTTICSCESREEWLARRDAQEKAYHDEEVHSRFEKTVWEGHAYVIYTHSMGYGGGVAIVHDPDCHCRKGDIR